VQWLQDPNQSIVDNLNNARREVSKHFGKRGKYLKAKVNKLETYSTNKNIRELCRGINVFKKGQTRTNIVKNETGDVVAYSHSILGKVEEIFVPAIECTWR
jgi:hypothetical protein